MARGVEPRKFRKKAAAADKKNALEEQDDTQSTYYSGGIQMTEVVAALVRDGDRFMICRRPAHKARGLLWEFVGGKVEAGETGQQALARECREELGIEITVGDVYMDVIHEYPDLTVHLTLFEARITKGEPQLLEHNAIAWITPSETDRYEFCPADREILDKIKGE